MELAIKIYILIGLIVGIYLARLYWKEFRKSNHKSNIVTGYKIVDRLIDSFVFTIAYIFLIFLYPIYVIELIINNKKNKNKGVLK